ncbi:hypothetical protein ALT785_100004 [Alteromonas infernus]
MSAFDSAAFLKNLTSQPGVYRMYNSQGEVIYVGKAKNLKKRVSSYFRTHLDNAKTRSLVSQIADMDVTVVNSETEAFLLENNFIKKYKPRYNVVMRDDKSYPFIFLSDHEHPRLSFHRGPQKKKGESILAHIQAHGRYAKVCALCSEYFLFVSAKIAIIARAVGLVFNIKCSAAVPLALKGTSATKNIKNRLTLPACF